MLNLIVAVSKNNVIGKNGKLPWNLPSDLKYFYKQTKNAYLIMGKTTYFSIKEIYERLYSDKNRFFGGNRNSIVLTDSEINPLPKNVVLANSIESALKLVENKNAFVIGGASIYKQFLPIVDRLYITRVDALVENGDSFFPEINMTEWKLISSKRGKITQRDSYPIIFEVYDRI